MISPATRGWRKEFAEERERVAGRGAAAGHGGRRHPASAGRPPWAASFTTKSAFSKSGIVYNRGVVPILPA